MFELLDFITLTYEDKVKVMGWRNNPQVRQFMENSDEISLKGHLDFIETLKNRRDKYFLVRENGVDIGVIYFVTKNDNTYFGLYKATCNFTKGVGQALLKLGAYYSITKMGLPDIQLYLKRDNLAALNTYKKFGFIQYLEDSKFIYMRYSITRHKGLMMEYKGKVKVVSW